MDGRSPFSQKLKPLADWWLRHTEVFAYLFKVILPVLIRTRRRPVIFSRYSGMGDIICTIPAAQRLMQRHPGATFIYNCHPDFADLPRLAGVADPVTSVKSIGLLGPPDRFPLRR